MLKMTVFTAFSNIDDIMLLNHLAFNTEKNRFYCITETFDYVTLT